MNDRRATSGASERRLVSVLFVDLVGFTSLSEGREAEDVRELLGRYFDVARRVVERYGGTIEKFIGDAVMAVWGAQAAHEDDAERAVRAALEIVGSVPVFGAETGAPDLRARAGVVTGQAAAVDKPDEGIVVGDRVNTASRVQSTAEPGSVLVDGVTRQLAQAAISFTDAGKHAVKGKEQPLHLWRAGRVISGVGGRDGQQLFDAPFVGRDSELRLVKELLHSTVERASARLVAIFGEAGVGKSRLHRELSNYADGLATPLLWHTGRCLAHGDGVAYWAFATMIRQRLGISEDARAEEAAAKLDAGLAEWVIDPEEREFIRPRLGALIGVDSPGLDRAELFAGWRLFLERLATHHPVVLLFEDMQWADDGLLAFIDQILDWSRGIPILIVTFARPELSAKHDGWPTGRRGVTTIDLEPLTDAAMRELIDATVRNLPTEARDRIVERAQGVPLYAVETIRALASSGTLTQTDGQLAATGDVGNLQTPASLSALLAARLDALEPDERELVKALSVFGGTFPRHAGVALSGLAEDQVDELLAALVRKQVFVVQTDPLSPDRGQYGFAQELLRSAAYETLARGSRKQLHLTAADHLRAAFPNQGEEVAEVIANHVLGAYEASNANDADHAELAERAVEALQRASERADEVGAPRVAAQALQRAAGLADQQRRPELLLEASWQLALSGRLDEALALADDARSLFSADGRTREAAMTAETSARILLRKGMAQDAMKRLEAALAVMEPLTEGRVDAGAARLQIRLADAQQHLGEYEQALPAVELGLSAAGALELTEVLADGLGVRALVCEFMGRRHEAEALYRAAIEIAERSGHHRATQRSRANLAALALSWSLPEARKLLEDALVDCQRRGDESALAVTTHNLMELEINESRLSEAESLGNETLTHLEDPGAVANVEYQMLRIHALRGDGAHTREALQNMKTFADSSPWYQGLYATAEVIASAETGDQSRTLALGLEALDRQIGATGIGFGLPIDHALPNVLDAALELDDLDAARRIVDYLTNRPAGNTTPSKRAHGLRAQALLAAAEGREDEVEPRLRAAIERFCEIRFFHWQIQTEAELERWLERRTGDATVSQARGTV